MKLTRPHLFLFAFARLRGLQGRALFPADHRLRDKQWLYKIRQL